MFVLVNPQDFKNAFFDLDSTEHVTDLEILTEIIKKTNVEDEALWLPRVLYDVMVFMRMKNDNRSQIYQDHKNDFMFLSRICLIEYFIFYRMHKYFFSDDEVKKIEYLIERKDYKSNLFTRLIRFMQLYIISTNSYDEVLKLLKNRLSFSMNKAYDQLENDIISSKIKSLKNWLNSSVGKLDNSIYYLFVKSMAKEAKHNYFQIVPNYVAKHFNEKFGYEIFFYNRQIDEVFKDLGMTTIDLLNKEFDKHVENSLVNQKLLEEFLVILSSYNQQDYGIKLVDKLIEGISTDQGIKNAIEDKKPLAYGIPEFKKRFIKYIILMIYKNSKYVETNEKTFPLTYPLVTKTHADIESTMQIGKSVFNEFIQFVYEEKADSFLTLFNQPNLQIREFKTFGGYSKTELFMRNSYEMNRNVVNYPTIKEIINILQMDFYSEENMLKRMYLYIAFLKQTSSSNIDEILMNHFNFYIQIIEQKFGISPKRNNLVNNYDDKKIKLQSIMKKFDIDVIKSDDYYISMLDREIATIDQIDRFPVLEQVGDAIYEFIIMESLLYNLDVYDSNEMTNRKNNLVKAETQVILAKSIELDQCYISNKLLRDKIKIESFEKSFEYIDKDEEPFKEDNSESYLADSLEMIIGSIYFQEGIKKAVEFTKKVIENIFPNVLVNLELSHVSLDDISSLTSENIKILDRIKPSFDTLYLDRNKGEIYYTFGSTLLKLFSILSFGNTTLSDRYFLKNVTWKTRDLYVNDVNIQKYLAIYYLYYEYEKTIKQFNKVIKPILLNKD